MASWLKPKLLLLDEHTAALDPRSADQVIQLSEEIIARDKLTTLMVTHSMQQATHLGDRLVMMHRGQVIHDFRGAEKQRLRADDLLTASRRSAARSSSMNRPPRCSSGSMSDAATSTVRRPRRGGAPADTSYPPPSLLRRARHWPSMTLGGRQAEPIRVGVLHSLSGTMAISERAVVEAT